MDDTREVDLKSRDYLTLASRTERRNLLIASFTSIVIVQTGLLPTKISALGIELSPSNQSAFFVLLASLVVYFWIGFILYSVSDYLRYKSEVIDTSRERFRPYLRSVTGPRDEKTNDDKALKELYPSRSLNRLASFVYRMRIIFDFVLPVVLGIWATIILINHW